MSNSSPIPVPIAVMIAWISAFDRTLLIRFFSELMTFPRSVPRARRLDRLLDDLPRVGRVLLEVLRELLVDGLLDETADPGVAELRLRLPLELRIAQLHGDDGGETLAHVLAVEVLFLLLQQAEL